MKRLMGRLPFRELSRQHTIEEKNETYTWEEVGDGLWLHPCPHGF
jgi:hypothetical protein